MGKHMQLGCRVVPRHVSHAAIMKGRSALLPTC